MSFRSGCAFALIAFGSAVSLGGCVANDVSITIDRFVAATGVAGSCSVDPASTVSQSSGVFDAEISAATGMYSYYLGFAMTNHLPLRNDIVVDVQAYTVDGYDLQLEVHGPAVSVIPNGQRFSIPGSSARLEPGASVGPVIQVFSSDVVGKLIALGPNLNVSGGSHVTAKVRARVKRAEEQHVTAYATFPIDVCWGCLSNVQPTTTNCDLVPTALRAKGNPCNPAQDVPITCCTPNGTTDVACGSSIPPAPAN